MSSRSREHARDEQCFRGRATYSVATEEFIYYTFGAPRNAAASRYKLDLVKLIMANGARLSSGSEN